MGALEEKLKFNEEFTEYVNLMREMSDKSWIQKLADKRRIPIEELESSGIFRVNKMAEMLIPKFIKKLPDFGVISNTNNMPIFSSRWVIPIYNQQGLVENLVGYSDEADERYIYGTAKYYDRNDFLYGLENINLAYEMGWAILVEGITDAIRVRSMGFKNCFASCGTRKSTVKMNILNRCRHGIVLIHDRDMAGYNTQKHWEVNRFARLYVPKNRKDVDEAVREDGPEWANDYIAA